MFFLEFFGKLDFLALDPSAFASEVVKVEVADVVADRVATLALLLKLLNELLLL